jgi:integrase
LQDELADDGFVFSADVGGREPWYPDLLSRRLRSACRHVGLEGVRLHDLRHYVATRLLSAGVDVRTVAGRLGHRNAVTTLNVYSHFVPQADREAAEILGGLSAADSPLTD